MLISLSHYVEKWGKYGKPIRLLLPMAVAGALLGVVMFCLSRIQPGWQLVVLLFIIGSIGMEGVGGNLYMSWSGYSIHGDSAQTRSRYQQ